MWTLDRKLRIELPEKSTFGYLTKGSKNLIIKDICLQSCIQNDQNLENNPSVQKQVTG